MVTLSKKFGDKNELQGDILTLLNDFIDTCAKGSGKTYALINELRKHPDKNVLVVTPRCLLGEKIRNDFNNTGMKSFKFYKDIRDCLQIVHSHESNEWFSFLFFLHNKNFKIFII